MRKLPQLSMALSASSRETSPAAMSMERHVPATWGGGGKGTQPHRGLCVPTQLGQAESNWVGSSELCVTLCANTGL